MMRPGPSSLIGRDKQVNLPVRFAGGAGGETARRMKVTAVENDYLVCSQLDADGNVIATDIKVAKPPELRHDKDWYSGLTGLSTINSQSVSATDGVDTETWIVKPTYIVAKTEIAAMAVAGAFGLDVGGPLQYVDMNVAGRVWGVEEE